MIAAIVVGICLILLGLASDFLVDWLWFSSVGYLQVFLTAISIFNNHAGAEESNRRGLAWIEQNLAPLLIGPATAVAGPVIVHTLA